MTTTRTRSAGFSRAWYVKSTSGIPTDTANLTADADSATSFTRLYAASSAGLDLSESVVVPIEGDDGVDGQFIFESSELLTFNLTVGRKDFAHDNLLAGTSTIDLQSTFSMQMIEPQDRDFVDTFYIFTRRSQDDNSAGKYENILVPLTNGKSLGSPFQTRAAGAFNYQINANRVTQTFYGADLSSSVGGKEAATAFRIFSDYPLMIDVWKQDGVETDFLPAHTPRTGGNVLAWNKSGSSAPTTQSITYDSPVSGSWNLDAAGTDGDIVIILYELA